MKIELKSIYVGSAIGLLVAFFVAALPSAMDWHGNPSGIFRSESATNWSILFETWFSWFWPVALVSTPGAVLTHAYFRNRGAANAT